MRTSRLGLDAIILIKNVSINPKCWNSNSLKISLDAINPGELPVGSTLSMNIVITEQLK